MVRLALFRWVSVWALMLIAVAANAQLAASPWPKFHGTAMNTGMSTASGATNVLKWSFATGNAITSSPAIGPGGVVYVGSNDSNVYAVNGSSGAVSWSFMTGGAVVSSPAVGANGLIYIGSNDGNVYALNASGVMVWTFAAGSPVESSPAIGPDGTVYIGADNGLIYALNGATGIANWSFKTGGQIHCSPAVGADGTVYVGSEDGNVYGINGASGTDNWVFETGAPIESSPAVGLNGTVYIGSDNGNVYALNGSTGALVWLQAVYAQFVNSSPAVGSDGTVYVGANSTVGYFYALDGVTGAVKWNFASGKYIDSSPAVAADGTIYVGGSTSGGDGVLYALNGLTGVQEWAFGTGDPAGIFSSPAIGADGAVYFGSNDGQLYALVGVHAQSLGLSPYSVAGGNTSTGTVVLSAPAPAGGETVVLACASPNVTIPASISIPEGQTSATFTISTIAVDAQTSAVITATFGITLSATLTIAPPTVQAISLDPPELVGGATSTGTVTLTGPAGPSGLTILVSSDNLAAQVPATLSFGAGQSVATFTVSTSSVGSTAAADITAALGSTNATTTLTVDPVAITSLSLSPATVTGGSQTMATITLDGPAGPGGTVVEVTTNVPFATVPATVTVPEAQTSQSFNIATESVGTQSTAIITAAVGSVWQTAMLTVNPLYVASVSLSSSTVFGGASVTGTVTLNSPAIAGGVTVALSSNSTAAGLPSSVVIAAGQTSATFTVTTSVVNANALAVITASYNGFAQTADLSVTTTSVLAVSVTPGYAVEGSPATGTLSLNGPAGKSGVLVKLASNNSSVVVPASVKFLAGQTFQTFSIGTKIVAKQSIAVISATLNGSSQSANLILMPLEVLSVNLSASTVSGGASVSGTLTLNGAAPRGGRVVLVTSNTPYLSVPSTVTVPEGKTSADFSVTTFPVSSQKVATVTAGIGSSTASSLLTINPPELLAIGLSPATVLGGKSSIGTVTLTGQAPNGGITVELTSDQAAAKIPTYVKVYAGRTKGAFTVLTQTVSTLTVANISAAVNGFHVSTGLNIEPPSLISLTLNPATVVGGKYSTATVTISGPAPAGGIVVTLASTSADAAAPPTVTIPAGKRMATFTIATSAVQSKETSVISATATTSTVKAVLTIK